MIERERENDKKRERESDRKIERGKKEWEKDRDNDNIIA